MKAQGKINYLAYYDELTGFLIVTFLKSEWRRVIENHSYNRVALAVN